MILEEYTQEHIEQRTARKIEKISKELQDTQKELHEQKAENARLLQIIEDMSK